MRKISLVVTDLDDTLWDWVGLWYASYRPFFEKIAEIRGVDFGTVLESVKRVNQKHRTSEYTFLLQEMDITNNGEDPCVKYAEAIEIFREARRAHLKLYPTVEESLAELKEKGCMVVAYTESHEFETKYRLLRTGADRFIDYLYSPADYDPPETVDLDKLKKESAHDYTLSHTNICHTPRGSRKPNPEVLLEIIATVGATPERTLYIGDKLPKDVVMAQKAGVLDAWAQYGASHHREMEYGLLKRVTHWSNEEVAKEQEITAVDIKPTIICHNNYRDFLEYVSIQPL